MKKRLFLMGLPRCATTTLANVLVDHPEIARTTQKEPHYYLFQNHSHLYSYDGSKRVGLDSLGFESSRDNYFSKEVEGKWYLDASTLYSSHPRSVADIVEENKGNELKFIILFRAAEKRAFSHYKFSKSRGEEPASTFVNALVDEIEGKRENWLLGGYIRSSRLKPVYERLLNYVDKKNVLLVCVDDEDIVSTEFLNRVNLFLGVTKHNYHIDVYTNESSNFSNEYLIMIRVFLRKFRQLNPDLLDNRYTRYLFHKFMSMRPKQTDTTVQQYIPQDFIDRFDAVDRENLKLSIQHSKDYFE